MNAIQEFMPLTGLIDFCGRGFEVNYDSHIIDLHPGICQKMHKFIEHPVHGYTIMSQNTLRCRRKLVRKIFQKLFCLNNPQRSVYLFGILLKISCKLFF